MLAGLLMMVALAGCFPATDKDGDEEKDPHFLRGRSLVGSQDFQGAVDEYEKALETNPRNASAHFELGWLDKEKVQPPDYAAAIYHYQRHLALRPDSGHAQQARDQILACKRALAETEFQLPSNPDLQR